jgi:hypothetical protein
MTSTLPWFYMWSQKYAFFHHMLQDDMKDSEIKLEPIFIEQAVFDAKLHQTEDGHAWAGCSMKIDLLIERLKAAKEPYILFTDVDIVVKPGIYAKLKDYMDTEISMVFLKEGEHLNIGFVLLKVCSEVLEFWELVKATIEERGGHDQAHVNDLIKDYPGTWTTFDRLFCCSNTWDGGSFLVIQPLCSNIGKEFVMAEKVFYAAQYTDTEKYMKYVPEEVIPYIYRFQEILIRSHQQAKRG